jgi:hypothetical protein
MVTPLATHTLGDVLTAVQRQFGDEDSVQITDADITRWVNEAQTEINSKDPMIQATGTVVTTGLETSFPLPTDLMQLDMVVYDTTRLTPVDASDGVDQVALLGTGGSAPVCFYTWANAIYLVPAPDVANHTLTIYYIARPTSVATASDLLGVPDRYFNEVVSYAMTQAYELDQDWQAQTVQNQAFEKGMQDKMLSNRTVVGGNHVIRDVDESVDLGWY